MNKSKNDYTLTLSVNLKELIKQKGVTITFLARNTVSLQIIHGWLQGSHPKNLVQLRIIADFFEKDIDSLCFKRKANQHLDERTSEIFEISIKRL